MVRTICCVKQPFLLFFDPKSVQVLVIWDENSSTEAFASESLKHRYGRKGAIDKNK